MRAADDRSTVTAKNGRTRDLDVRVKPFRLEKAESSSKPAASKNETSTTPAAQDSKSVSTSSVKAIVRLKYEMCKNFKETGSCKYGDRCLFAHGDHELINRAAPPSTTTTSAPPASSADKKEDPKVENEKEEEDKVAGNETRVNETTNDSTKVIAAAEIADSSTEKEQKLTVKE